MGKYVIWFKPNELYKKHPDHVVSEYDNPWTAVFMFFRLQRHGTDIRVFKEVSLNGTRTFREAHIRVELATEEDIKRANPEQRKTNGATPSHSPEVQKCQPVEQ